MSNVPLGLSSHNEYEALVWWTAKKWRPLWYWYASWSEACEIVATAFLKADATWDQAETANRTTWAINGARLEFLTQHAHEKRMKRARFTPRSDLVSVAVPEPEHLKQQDTRYLVNVIRSSLPPRMFFVIWQRANGDTLDTVGQMLGITRERVRQLEQRAKDKARRVVTGLVAKNRCAGHYDLY
jgi:RNA polymerase sigma factor (sigma-70 family)